MASRFIRASLIYTYVNNIYMYRIICVNIQKGDVPYITFMHINTKLSFITNMFTDHL